MSAKLRKKVKFKIKTWYYLELLTPKTMKLLKSTERRIGKDKNGENIPHLDITKGCIIVDNQYQHDLKVLSTFVPNKSLVQLLNRSPTNHIYSEILDSEFSYIKLVY